MNKNKLGKWFFAILGIVLTVIVFYPYVLEYLYLTERPEKEFGSKEIIILTFAFVSFWGSAKFTSLAESFINKWSRNNRSDGE